MLTNVLISEFLNLDDALHFMFGFVDKSVTLKHFSAVLFSSISGDVIHQFSQGVEVENDSWDALISNIRKSSDKKLAFEDADCFILDANKQFGEGIFEVLVSFTFNHDTSKTLGLAYFSVDASESEKIINYLSDEFNMKTLSSTINLLQFRLDVYEKMFTFIDVFSELLKVKDRFMPYHMSNVGKWCNKMSNQLDLSSKDRTLLYLSALMHDIGKSFITDEIINKPGKLTDEEYEMIKNHSSRSYDITHAELSGLPLLDSIPSIVRSHHERYDGSGYPDGLKGEEIPRLSRILTICDTIDAMLSRRSYKDRNSINEVMSEIVKCSGAQFDPTYAEQALLLLEKSKRELEMVSISKMNFIPLASLSFIDKETNKQNTFIGNLVLSESTGKLIIHSEEKFPYIDLDLIAKPHISFFNYNDISEYEVNISGILGNQLVLKDMIYVPLDKYFSMVWEFKANLYLNDGLDVDVIKIGGDQLVLQVDLKHSDILSEVLHHNIKMDFVLEVGSIVKSYNIEIRPIQYYRFAEKEIYVCRYENITTSTRDSIIKMMFKKQIQERMQK